MKKLLDVRHFIIIILLLIALVEFINPKGIMPHRVKIQTDSIPYAVHDTIPVDSLVEVEVEVEKPVPFEVEKRIEVPVIQPVDTNEIIKQHFAKVQYKDVLKLPNNQGTVTITDTIANNTIVNRKFIADVKRMIVRDTIYTPIPRKTEVYLGFDGQLDKPNVMSVVGLSMLFKNKDDKHMYRLGVGLANRVDDKGTNGKFEPFLSGGAYWKLKLR